MGKNNFEDDLAKILSNDHAPEIDENARKRAVNMAMAEFKMADAEKNKKYSQGVSFFSRLIGMNNKYQGEKSMERKTKNKLIYGGAATAMAVIFVAGLSMTQMNETLQRFEDASKSMGSKTATLRGANINVIDQVAPASKLVSEEKHEADFAVDVLKEALSIPVPIETPPTRLDITEAKAKKDDAAHRWRRLEEDTRQLEKEVVADSLAPMPSTPSALGKAMPAKSREMTIISSPDVITPQYHDENRDKFNEFEINPFKQVTAEPVSTFSSDVDTASYSFVRRQLNNGNMPQKDAVRVEEMVNYFDYNYPLPENKAEPFKPTITVVDSPWAQGKKLMHIGIKGYDVPKTSIRSNLVFLLDVSGSMNEADKLPLVKNSMKMLLDSLHPDDTVSIVTYAGRTGVVLEPTRAANRSTIIDAMNNLNAGGGTAGAAGIALAYDMAEQNFNENAVNRVILATDGDFNVGITNQDELKSYVEKKREKGIFLSVLGFGQGNYNDAMMQTLAQNGNGIAAYIDNLNEARKVLVQEATSSLFPIAGDVKFQVEFNPTAVAEYRLVGYETRSLNREDFNNDKIDAGDMGAGHSVTAIYEFVPVGSNAVSVDALRYGDEEEKLTPAVPSDEYAFLKIRYKLPMEKVSKLITAPVIKGGSENVHDFTNNLYEIMPGSALDIAQREAKFSVAVAAFGQILKGGQYTGNFTYDDVIALAQQGKGDDAYGYRAEFINMVRLAQSLSR